MRASHRSSPTTEYSRRAARPSGASPRSEASFQTRNTRVMPCCRNPTRSTSPDQEDKDQRGRDSTVLRRRKPRSHHRPGRIRDGAARDRATRQGKEIPQLSPCLLQQNQMRRVRLLVRLKGLALQKQIPEGHLAVQPQVRRRQDLLHATPDGRGDSGRLP